MSLKRLFCGIFAGAAALCMSVSEAPEAGSEGLLSGGALAVAAEHGGELPGESVVCVPAAGAVMTVMAAPEDERQKSDSSVAQKKTMSRRIYACTGVCAGVVVLMILLLAIKKKR